MLLVLLVAKYLKNLVEFDKPVEFDEPVEFEFVELVLNPLLEPDDPEVVPFDPLETDLHTEE